jgi:hypothetical protein
MPTVQKLPLHLLLDEVEMIAYARETEPVCFFYFDNSFNSDAPVERARDIVLRINVHDALLAALKFALPFMEDLANSSDNKGERRAAKLMREAIRKAQEGEP